MRLTRRTGLVIIVGLAILGGVLVATSGAIADIKVRDSLLTIRELYLPKMKLGPKLDAQLEKIKRGFQDAVAAQDPEVLNTTHMWVDEVSEIVASAQPSVSSSDAGAIRNAFKNFYDAGLAVSRRLMHNETGEALLQGIEDMQDREKQTADIIARVTSVDADGLDRAFADIVRAQTLVARVRLAIIVGFLTVIAIIAVFLAKHLRNEEKRRDELMAQASRELDLLSTPRSDRPEPIDLAQLARDCGALVKQANPVRTVELDVSGAMHAELEPALARLLIDALLKHAWKVTAHDDPARVEVGSTTVAGEVCYFVRNGTSIDQAAAKSLFSSPTGFGTLRAERSELGTAQRVVRRCGGRIWAESTPGKGTTISFTLPTGQIRSS